LGRISTHCW